MSLTVTDLERVERRHIEALATVTDELYHALEWLLETTRESESGRCEICGAAKGEDHDEDLAEACWHAQRALGAIREAEKSDDFDVRSSVTRFAAQSCANGVIRVTYTATEEPIEEVCSAYGVFTRMAIARWVEETLNGRLLR